MSNQVKYYKAKYIIAWDKDKHKILENGYMGVKDGKVYGFAKELPEETPYEDLGAAAIAPGFVNLHAECAEVYVVKSTVEDIINPRFYSSTLMDYPYPEFGDRAAEIQCLLSCSEFIKSGCTTNVIAGSAHSRMEAEAADKMGIRAYVTAGIRAGDAKEAINVWDSPDGHSVRYNFNEEEGFARIREAEEFVKDYEGAGGGRIRTLLGPTQTMTCTPNMFRATRELADKLGVGITVRTGEDVIEFESCMRLHGKSPVQLMADTGVLGEDVIIGHCVYTHGHPNIKFQEPDKNRRDLKLLADSKTNVAHCPSSVARIGDAFHSILRYSEAGINVGLGSDSFPPDYLQAMRLAALIGKIVEGTTYGVNAGQMFNMATINGAKALGRTDIGRLDAGANADFVVFKLNCLEMVPTRDIIKNLVYSTTRYSVERVFIGGDCLMRDGKIKDIDEEALCQEYQAIFEEAWEKMGSQMVRDKTMSEYFPMTFESYEI